MTTAKTLSVNILDREYMVACPDGAEEELETAARFLDKKMHEIKASGKVYGLERIAVMAALNLTHELIHKGQTDSSDAEKIDNLVHKIDSLLSKG